MTTQDEQHSEPNIAFKTIVNSEKNLKGIVYRSVYNKYFSKYKKPIITIDNEHIIDGRILRSTQFLRGYSTSSDNNEVFYNLLLAILYLDKNNPIIASSQAKLKIFNKLSEAYINSFNFMCDFTKTLFTILDHQAWYFNNNLSVFEDPKTIFGLVLKFQATLNKIASQLPDSKIDPRVEIDLDETIISEDDIEELVSKVLTLRKNEIGFQTINEDEELPF